MQPLPRARGADVQEFQVDSDSDEEEDGIRGVNEELEKIWRQFPADIFLVAPNGRTRDQPSHLLMYEHERLRATWDDFKTLDLRNKFHAVHVKSLGLPGWKIMFDYFFPGKDTIVRRGDKQNYPFCLYYQWWMALIGRLTAKQVRIVKSILLKGRQA